MKRPSIRRVYSLDHLPMVRFWFHGPKWQRHCGVGLKLLADVSPSSVAYHRPGKVILTATLEDDIRERILERLYHERYAMWSDPLEHFDGIRHTGTRRLHRDHSRPREDGRRAARVERD